MLHKTSGIILHATKYSETSLIVQILTLDFGVKSYIVNGVHGKKSKNKINLFQPMGLVDLVVKHNEKSGLQRISEISVNYPYTEIPYQIVKSSVVLFLNEIVYKAVKEQHSDENMFEFIKNSLQILDLRFDNNANFHIYFMVQLSRYLGFFPEGNYDATYSYFDLQEGKFVRTTPTHVNYLDAHLSELLNGFLGTDYTNLHLITMNKVLRKQLLQALINYYQLHVSSFGDIKSLDVLEEVIG